MVLKVQKTEAIAGPLLIGAVVLAISCLGAASLVSQSFDRGAYRFREMASELGVSPVQPLGRPAADGPKPNADTRSAPRIQGAPRRGGDAAKVILVEWSDFQCPFCTRVNETLRQVEAAYGDRVALVFKHLPLPMHPGAPAAHAAAEAAHGQGQFWAMHDKIFANPHDVETATLVGYAEEIGLDMERFRRDWVSDSVRARIRADAEEAEALGVTGTPSFFVNGRFLSGAQPIGSFKRLIDEELSAVR